jgi:hypothetical protein
MELSLEDSLCLNVMLATDVRAIRIDEPALTIYGLTDKGEATVKLHPVGRKEQYLKLVRETLSEHALDSPGGYPVYLRRWTRMGQNLGENLDKLLLLGEPEAVISVAYSPKITNELARDAWWVMPTADNARRMLERPCVVEGSMGKVLAEYLVEHLPFETDPHQIINSVRIVLQPGLLDEESRLSLWHKTKHNNAYYVGFLECVPDNLPNPASPRADWITVRNTLAALIEDGNPYARLLERILSGQGQTFLRISEEVMLQPSTQDVVRALFNAMAGYFSAIQHIDPAREANLETVLSESQDLLDNASGNPALQAVLAVAPTLRAEIQTMLVLSACNQAITAPILNRTTAVGTLMRRKLEPITSVVHKHMSALM